MSQRETPGVRAIEEIKCELIHARHAFPSFASAHEGYAVILEELDELWDEVRKNQKVRDGAAMRKEALQVATMALRFALDVDECRKADKEASDE